MECSFLLYHVLVPCLLMSVVTSLAPMQRDQRDLRDGDGAIPPIQVSQTQTIVKEEKQAQREELETLKRHAGDVASVAHEVRTPLNAMLACCTLLQDTRLSPEQSELVQLMAESGQQILDNVNCVLELARLKEGKVKLAAAAFRVREDVCQSVADMVRHLAGSKGLRVRVEVEEGLPVLVGDAARLRQALMNLLSNAIKFTERGSVTIHASVTASESSVKETASKIDPYGSSASSASVVTHSAEAGTQRQAVLQLEVLDTGLGISVEDEAKLFQRFGQASASTYGMHGGSGMGLLISKELLTLMGGTLGVDRDRTAVGRGSCFVVKLTLPVAETNDDDMCASGSGTSHHVGRLFSPGGSNIISAVPATASPGAAAAASATMVSLPSSVTVHGAAGLPSPNSADCSSTDSKALEEGFDESSDRGSYSEIPLCSHRSIQAEGAASDSSSLRWNIRFAPTTHRNWPQEPVPLNALNVDVTPHASVSGTGTPILSPHRHCGVGGSALEVEVEDRFSRYTVLLVDDNAINVRVMERLLQSMGFHSVLVARSGAEAVRQFELHPELQLVLTDLSMPDMSGYELASEIRRVVAGRRDRLLQHHQHQQLTASFSGAVGVVSSSRSFGAETPGAAATRKSVISVASFSVHSPPELPVIVAISGAVESEVSELCQQAGISCFLAKPVERQQLASVASRWLREYHTSLPVAGEGVGLACVSSRSHASRHSVHQTSKNDMNE